MNLCGLGCQCSTLPENLGQWKTQAQLCRIDSVSYDSVAERFGALRMVCKEPDQLTLALKLALKLALTQVLACEEPAVIRVKIDRGALSILYKDPVSKPS